MKAFDLIKNCCRPLLFVSAAVCAAECGDIGAADSVTFASDDTLPVPVVDVRDGQAYKVVSIGGKMWMARNMNYKAGDSWCYDYRELNCDKYGRLYDWEAAKRACPTGWHLPFREEWDSLAAALGGWEIAGKKLKAAGGWQKGGNGADEFGFSALPGGYRYIEGNFLGAGVNGGWWTSTESSGTFAYFRRVDYDYDYVYEISYFKKYGFSVRCIQDD